MERLFAQKKGKKLYPSMLRHLVCLVLILKAAGSYAQAPTISYSTPQVYTQGTAITPLVPTAANVGSFGYGSAVSNGFGSLNPSCFVYDSNGVLFGGFGNKNIKVSDWRPGN